MAKVEPGEKATPYDIFTEQKWLFLIIGFGSSRKVDYVLYIIFLFTLNMYVQCMAVYAAYLVAPNKNLIIDALHVSASGFFATYSLACRMFTDRSIMHMRSMVSEGIYNYENEDIDIEHEKMKSTIIDEVKRKTGSINLMYTIGFFSNMVFFPLSQLLILSEEDKINFQNTMNPYLPHVYYSPFDTNSTIGYLSAYLLDFFFWLCLYSTVVSTNGIYISSTVQLKVHLEVLNHSIRNIERRAYMLYKKSYNETVATLSTDDLQANQDFRNCVYSCFKANVRHHQALLRFKNTCQPFIGSCLLGVFTVASLIYATMLYLMYQSPPINVLVNYAFTSLAEQTYCLFLCSSGEEVIAEGNKLYETLYNIPWFKEDKRFNKSLDIMMCNTRNPLTLRAMLINVDPSLKTYGDILSAMYKLMNIARQSDFLK